MTHPSSFRIEIAEERVAALKHRLDAITWPNVPAGVDGHGIAIERVKGLVDYWRTSFDWSEFEAQLNEFHQVIDESGEYPLHLVYERAKKSTGVPIVLLHGWPDSFLRYRKLVPLLTAAGHDVIVPSLPGFGFSGQPTQPLTVATAAERVHAALSALGVDRYALHGGDFGSVVADEMIAAYPHEVVAVHLIDVPFTKHFAVDRSTFTPAERQFAAKTDEWMEKAVYFTVQSAEPLTLAYGLTDSPVGLLAWVADKFDAWSTEVDPEDVVGLAAMTWLTGTTWSGMRLYADDAGQDWGDESAWGDDAAASWGPTDDNESDGNGVWGGGSSVPAAFSVFPKDIGFPPREYCERFYDVVQFDVHASGGHFAATEQPSVLAAEITSFLAEVESR